MKKGLKLTKNWSKIEKNEFLFGENIKSHSKKWSFSIEKLSKNSKKKIVFYGKTLKIHEKVVKISKKLV